MANNNISIAADIAMHKLRCAVAKRLDRALGMIRAIGLRRRVPLPTATPRGITFGMGFCKGGGLAPPFIPPRRERQPILLGYISIFPKLSALAEFDFR
ncbi:hypothetical protein EH240_31040 [Mesorhizobium tamadayense]|uniref:Uncharacterized protein n=1 Tax=Mesorhizobium tamadayense TaxID=425306 RepID=A0A3P3F0I1_9HYPH|nr:hypothetical protein [Mesorhizobium tamadayense]RRH92153.1 hypothetical protein EH240_31040 [Mesorhizobium tamadayense]